MSPMPTSVSVRPRSRSGSTSPIQRRSRCAARYVSIRWLTHEHQPMTYSLIHEPNTPGARVTITRRRRSGTSAHSTPAPIACSQRNRLALP